MRERNLRESRVEAERLLLATRAALAADGDLLDAAQRAAVDAAAAALDTAREGSDHHAIDDAVEALSACTEGFAAERMNRGIRQALAGRRVDDL